jgi:hypothetical protein
MKKLKSQINIANHTCAVIAALLAVNVLPASAQTLIYEDTFPGSAQNLDGAPTTGISGLNGGAGGALPQSAAAEQTINGSGQLQLTSPGGYGSGDSGYMRFDTIGSSSTLYNWASSPGASAITAAGGFTVSFGWAPPNTTSDDWIYFAAGADPSDSFGYGYSLQVLSANTASGIILANNGNVQTFNGGASGPSGTFATQAANVVTLTYNFTSWAAGAPVTMSAAVNGNTVISGDSFAWASGDAGANYLDLGTYQTAGGLINNFEIATVPEPSTWTMVMGGMGLLFAHRKLQRRLA